MTETDTPDWRQRLDALPTTRSCGDCELCCTVLRIDELDKPPGRSCVHQTGRGCAIWGAHPPSCKSYVCLWRMSDSLLPAEMFPAACGFVLSVNHTDAWPAMVTVREAPDAAPLAWSRAPHFDRLRQLAAAWNCPVAVVDVEGRANQVFTPMGRFYARRTRPDMFGEDGRTMSLPDGEFGPARRPPMARMRDAV